MATGHSRIDADHQKLVGLVDRLSSAMKEGKGRDACGQILRDLVAYTRTHFSMEEQLMATHKFPQAAQHKAEHEKLLDKVREFEKKYLEGSAALSVPLLQFLKDWLLHHIQESDKALAASVACG